ncbi:hypothetical protein ACGHA7_003375, partial [Pseudomonas aeruginosa]
VCAVKICRPGLVFFQGTLVHGSHLFLLFLMTKLSRSANGVGAVQTPLKPLRLRYVFSRSV